MKTDFDKFGIGISLYFRMVKFMATVMFFLFLISLPGIGLNVMAHKNKKDIKWDFNTMLFSTTLGSLAYLTQPCDISKYTS